MCRPQINCYNTISQKQLACEKVPALVAFATSSGAFPTEYKSA